MRTKGSAEALEMRRVIGVELLQEGSRGVREVGRLPGVAPATVSRWKRALEAGGVEALRARPHPGRLPKLSVEQKRELEGILLKGAQAAGFPTDLWTLGRVALVIEREFGVKYHPRYVWHILKGMGFSAQKPERRARERDEGAIAAWRAENWPKVKKVPRQRVAHSADRREWVHAATGCEAHLGAQREDTCAAQLGPARPVVGDHGHHGVPAEAAPGAVLSYP
jgi:transposase